MGSLPPDEKNKMLAHIYETLEMKVGMRLAEKMSNEQLDEFESFINSNDEQGALKWLESNFPNYKQVVAEELDRLKGEIRQVAPQILTQAGAIAGPSPQAAGTPQLGSATSYNPNTASPVPSSASGSVSASSGPQYGQAPAGYQQPAAPQPAAPQFGELYPSSSPASPASSHQSYQPATNASAASPLPMDNGYGNSSQAGGAVPPSYGSQPSSQSYQPAPFGSHDQPNSGHAATYDGPTAPVHHNAPTSSSFGQQPQAATSPAQGGYGSSVQEPAFGGAGSYHQPAAPSGFGGDSFASPAPQHLSSQQYPGSSAGNSTAGFGMSQPSYGAASAVNGGYASGSAYDSYASTPPPSSVSPSAPQMTPPSHADPYGGNPIGAAGAGHNPYDTNSQSPYGTQPNGNDYGQNQAQNAGFGGVASPAQPSQYQQQNNAYQPPQPYEPPKS